MANYSDIFEKKNENKIQSEAQRSEICEKGGLDQTIAGETESSSTSSALGSPFSAGVSSFFAGSSFFVALGFACLDF